MGKARTKADKLRSRRGRPKLPQTEREPNGRKSRRQASVQKFNHDTEIGNLSVAVARRVREYGLKDTRLKGGKILTAEEQAADPRRGYALGLLYLDGRVTEDQHDAGLRYAEDMARYYGLTGVTFPSTRAQNIFAVRGDDGEVSEGRATAAAAARSKMTKLRATLLDVGDIDTGRRVWHAVMEVAVMDNQACRTWPDHMIGYLRRGLNRLSDFYGGKSVG